MCAQGATVRWAILCYLIRIPTYTNNIVKALVPSGAHSAYNHKYRGLPVNSLLPPLGGWANNENLGWVPPMAPRGIPSDLKAIAD